jgi:hypothetical protein
MFRSQHIILFYFFLILIPGCQNHPISFDAELWRSDKQGCNGERFKIYPDLLDNQEEILGLTNKKIITLLGKPERNELYNRNQKFFIYNITPSTSCPNAYVENRLFLFIRFNAVGLSQEVFIQENPSFE